MELQPNTLRTNQLTGNRRRRRGGKEGREGGEAGLVSIQTSVFMGTLLLSGSRSLHLLSALDSMSALLPIYGTIEVIS